MPNNEANQKKKKKKIKVVIFKVALDDIRYLQG
jgi:hypothetical protein